MKLRTVPISIMMTTIADGEYFPLYPARLRSLVCEDMTPRSWLFPSGMRELIEHLREFVGPVERVVARNTLLPLFSRPLPAEHQAVLRNHFLEEPKMGLPAILGLNGPRSGWARATVARCPKCVEEDIAPCGNPFWRRDHLVPGLLFCGRHQLPLHVPCERCADFRGHPQLTTHPGMHCGCGLRALPAAAKLADADVASEVELASVASRLLDPTYLPHFNHAGVATVVAKTAQAHGLVQDGVVNWSRVDAFFKDSSTRPILARTTFPLERSEYFRLVLNGKRVLRHPLHNVVLLKALHGAWHAVEDAFSRLTGNEQPPVHEPKPKVVRPKPRAQMYREKWLSNHHARWFKNYAQQYRELRKGNPAETHSQLMRRLPFDASKFITRASLVAAGEDVPLFGAGDTYYELLDKSFCNHIRTTGRRLVEADYPGRLSKRTLLRGHRMDLAWSQIRGRMPLAMQALAECEESLSAYRKRRLLMLSKSGLFVGMCGLTKPQIDNLDDKTVTELLKQGIK